MNSYKIKENKTADIITKIGLGIFITCFVIGLVVLPILSFIFYHIHIAMGVAIFVVSLPVSVIFLVIGSFFSTIKKDTIKYVEEIKNRISEASSIDELKNIKSDFISEVVDEHHMIRLPFPRDIKDIIKELVHKIEILEKTKIKLEKSLDN